MTSMLKRVLDFVLSVVLLVLLLPVFVLVAVLVRFRLGSPVLFVQTRPGRFGQPFQLIKFRTMTSLRDDDGNLLPDELRLTPFGKWLRSTSLDELPELLNVVRGEMSLVGPRPLMPQYLSLYNERQARRHEVRPGITGWAQVNGRNTVDWGSRLEMDVWYVENQSLLLDLKILMTTIRKVFFRDGISSETHATCDEFRGDAG